MIWWKLSFILLVINGFDCKGNSSVILEEICKTNLLNATTSACRRNDELHLSFNWDSYSFLSNLEIKPDQHNCYKFNKTENNTFIVDISNKTQKFCEKYDLHISYPIAYYIEGSTLEQISECPNRTEVCIKDSCPLNSIDIVPMLNSTHEYINLNISWETISTMTYNASLAIFPVDGTNLKKHCYFAIYKDVSLSNKVIVVPNFPSSTDIETLCPFKISLAWGTSTCERFYTIPECVGRKCDCERYGTDVNITNVEHIQGYMYNVAWDFKSKFPHNETVEFTIIYFIIENRYGIHESVPHVLELNQTSKSAQIEMNLWKNDNYTLIGTFKNNFTCIARARFVFKYKKLNCIC